MDVFNILPETTLAEVIENQLYMSPAPTAGHQRILFNIGRQLMDYVEVKKLGEVFISPVDVYLDELHNAVQPDILFIRKSNLVIVNDSGPIKGVPDLIVEILSPGNQNHDMVKKKELYQKFKVSEYHVIDPLSKKATSYTLVNNEYELISEQIGKMTSQLLKKSFRL